MNIKNNLLILSDLHLERATESRRMLLLKIINEKIEKMKKQSLNPIVILAGDINKAVWAYDWIEKIKTEVIYIAGNHEFWEGDYYECIEYLKDDAPENVTFLHNDIKILDDYLFVGSTLWTDVGSKLNKDLLPHAGIRMNDNTFITAKSWYQDEKNIKKLKETFPDLDIEDRIAHRKWNPLVEIEENQKGWNFINNTMEVLSFIEKTSEINKRLKEDLTASYEWWRIDKKIFADTKEKIKLTDPDLTWEDLVDNLFVLHKNYSISEKERDSFLLNAFEKDVIFQKLRKIENITNKKLIVLTHHLPFYEEILVGSDMFNLVEPNTQMIRDIEKELFIIRDGERYPEENYLFKTSKGEIERSRDISHIVNYYNFGSQFLHPYALGRVHFWVHGHEHHFRHKEYVKGIPIVANPAGNMVAMLNIEDGKECLTERYLSLFKHVDKFSQKEINELKDNIILDNSNVEKDYLQTAIQMWILKKYNWEEHFKYLDKIEKSTKEILLLSVAYTQREDSGNEKLQSSLLGLEEKISIWMDSYNLNIQKLSKMHEDVSLAFAVRAEKNFDIQSYATKSLNTILNTYSWTMGNGYFPEILNDSVVGIFLAKKTFEAKGYLKMAIRHGEKLKELLAGLNFKNIHEIKKEHVDVFTRFNEENVSEEMIAEKIKEKWDMFYKKTFTIHANQEFKDSLKRLV